MRVRLTEYRKSRRLTLQGWLVVAGCIAISGYVWFISIHDFLAVNKPVSASVLVVEGYVPDFVLDSVANLWKNNPLLLIVCAGLPIKKGEFCCGYGSYADYNAAFLREKEIDSLQVIGAPARPVDKDRTYTSALAAKDKLRELGYESGKVDLVCLGTHARRSRLLYRKAFKSGWNIGVLSYPDNNYPEQWWKTSEGARAVVYEMFAYLYCIIFFRP